jgi:hypothetical protein
MQSSTMTHRSSVSNQMMINSELWLHLCEDEEDYAFYIDTH